MLLWSRALQVAPCTALWRHVGGSVDVVLRGTIYCVDHTCRSSKLCTAISSFFLSTIHFTSSIDGMCFPALFFLARITPSSSLGTLCDTAVPTRMCTRMFGETRLFVCYPLRWCVNRKKNGDDKLNSRLFVPGIRSV